MNILRFFSVFTATLLMSITASYAGDTVDCQVQLYGGEEINVAKFSFNKAIRSNVIHSSVPEKLELVERLNADSRLGTIAIYYTSEAKLIEYRLKSLSPLEPEIEISGRAALAPEALPKSYRDAFELEITLTGEKFWGTKAKRLRFECTAINE